MSAGETRAALVKCVCAHGAGAHDGTGWHACLAFGCGCEGFVPGESNWREAGVE